MSHILDLNENSDLNNLFKDIAEGNVILFLGAGASITKDKGFLSKHLIEYYQDKKHKDFGIKDVQTFVDVISNTPGLSRSEFDEYVDDCLRKLKPTEAHKQLASMNWRQIITTNYDLLIEQSFEAIQGTSHENLKLKKVRGKKELVYQCANDELKYIKLNGCLSSKKDFPLIFSSEDFKSVKKYYRDVLKELKNPSDKVKFLSIGYSFTDDFAKHLFNIIEENDYRDNRIMYNVDPYVENSLLPFFDSKKISVIKSSFDDFMVKYAEWEKTNAEALIKLKKLSFTNIDNSKISLNHKSLMRLEGGIKQLDNNYSSRFISLEDYYKGEEPDYNVIMKNYDVIKKDSLKNVIEKIQLFLSTSHSSLIPIVYLTGSFGTGKSTFAFRLINELTHSLAHDTLAFEVIDPSRINVHDLCELIQSSGAKNIILYFNSIEVDFLFKGLLDLRNKLSIEQINGFKIQIITTIRENILQRNKLTKSIGNSVSINVDEKLNDAEISDLLDKLNQCGLVKFRDTIEKKQLAYKIKNSFGSDSFISLLEIISNGKHIDNLIDAYQQLSNEGKEAFLYTSFLYQFKIEMPVGLLKNLVSNDWPTFKKNVIEAEGKGILIQEEVKANAADPDFYFRTKHPFISKKLIDSLVGSKDKRFKYYNTIINKLTFGYKNSILVINLLKAIRHNDELTPQQLIKLYDGAYPELSDDPYYLLHYAINLQHRKDEKSFEKAIEILLYAESLITYRNHKMIHRRAVINFELAKFWFNKEKSELVKTYRYIQNARDLFQIKLLYDPCSSYSYFNYIIFEIWILENLLLSEEEELLQRIKIEELFDLGLKVVFEYKDTIINLQNEYIAKFKFNQNEKEYLEYIEEKYGEPEHRPYALILKLNFYISNDKPKSIWMKYIEELEYFNENEEVAKFLTKHYGRNLNFVKNRLKFFEIVSSYDLETKDSLRFKYFSYIAEAYNKNFGYAIEILKTIKDKYNHLNADFQQIWKETDSEEEQIFEGIVIANKRGAIRVRIQYLNWDFPIKGNTENLKQGEKIEVVLHFYLNGIFAEVAEFED